MSFEHLLSPMKVGNRTYRNRVVSAPMAFSLVAQNPEAREVSYRKLEGPARGGNACVILGETDVNFRDAVFQVLNLLISPVQKKIRKLLRL